MKDVRAKIKAETEVWERQHPETIAPRPGMKPKVISQETVATFIKLLAGAARGFCLREQALTELADKEAKKMVDQGGAAEKRGCL